MSIHYLSNNLWDQTIGFLATHYTIVMGVIVILLVVACYSSFTNREDIAIILTLLAFLVFVLFPMARVSHNSYMMKNLVDQIVNQYVYHQPDYQIDSATTYQLHEVGDTYHHPTKEGWADTPTGQIKGQIANPQGQLTQVKHGEQSTDLVELTYTIGSTEHKATVHLSDDQFFYLWRTIMDKPLPLSVLDNGEFVVDNYHQPTDQK